MLLSSLLRFTLMFSGTEPKS